MAKILVVTEKPFAADAVASIKKVILDAGFEFALLEKYTDKGDFLKAVADADAVIIRSDIVDGEVMDAGKKLKIVVRAGAGVDNVDLGAATAKNIVVMNTPGQNSNAVAELALGMMIYQIRAFFSGKSGSELKGKKLGILGYGYIGKRLAEIAKGLGMLVYAYDPFVSKETVEKDGVTYMETQQEIYRTCSTVSLHFPSNDKTKGSVTYELLASMPKPAVVVNTARKELIDEAALLKMFAERSDFVYLSDVEPGCKEEIAAKFPGKYFFTPKKMGAQTAEANNNAGIAAASQIVDFLKTGNKAYQVNK
jgi:D-3-phosphoglycerate dehydrogenase